jgi:hypothetical protein
MANEAEYERLYQEFIRRGGGKYTFDSAGSTPVEYYSALDTSLTPEEKARLEADQEQYNRQAALNVIADEIAANNFTNPYEEVTDEGIQAYTALANDPGVIATSEMSNALDMIGDTTLRNELSDIIFFGGAVGRSVSLGGYGSESFNNATLAGIPGTPGTMLPIYEQIRQHTDGQVANFPKTLQDVSSLVGMNKQFGEASAGRGCDLFNQLMGILSGVFDGAFDFMRDITSRIKELLAPITDAIRAIKDQIMGFVNGIISDIKSAINSVIGPIMDVFNDAMSQLNNIMGQMTNLIGSIADQLAGEISGLLDLASNLLQKAQALMMAAAAFDVCQLATLLNVGGPAMQNALVQLTTPLSTALPAVPTQTDPRANKDQVAQTVAESRAAAATAPGVPQSPFRALATLYQPFSAYLHSATRDISGVLGSVFNSASSAMSANGLENTLQGLGQTISSSLSQTVNQIESMFGGNGTQSVIPSLQSPDVGARSPNTTSSVRSAAYNEFVRLYGSDLLQVRNNIKNVRLQMNTDNSRFNESQRSRITGLISQAASQEREITQLLDDASSRLTYSVSGNTNRDEAQEASSQNILNTILRDRSNRILTRSNSVLQNITDEWNSLRLQ